MRIDAFLYLFAQVPLAMNPGILSFKLDLSWQFGACSFIALRANLLVLAFLCDVPFPSAHSVGTYAGPSGTLFFLLCFFCLLALLHDCL